MNLENSLSINSQDSKTQEFELFLEWSRNNNLSEIEAYLSNNLKKSNLYEILNYRGLRKRYYGWSALHIAAYFNHIDVVKYLLKFDEIDINIRNNENDTALHKACLASRYDIAQLLITNNANINLTNIDGKKAKDLTSNSELIKLIQSAEKHDACNLQKLFFEAIMANNLEDVQKLLNNLDLDINCTDTFGNTALHLTSNRNLSEMAAYLIEKGINTKLKNKQGLCALDLCKSKEMKEILGYIPSSWHTYENYLYKKSKFFGFKRFYAILNKGSIVFYENKDDAKRNLNRKGTYNLQNALIKEYDVTNNNLNNEYLIWTIHLSNSNRHQLAVPNSGQNAIEQRNKWIESIKEHINYYDSFIGGGSSSARTINENSTIPLDNLQECLNTLKFDQERLKKFLLNIEEQLKDTLNGSSNSAKLQRNSSNINSVLKFKNNVDTVKSLVNIINEDVYKCFNLYDQRDALKKLKINELNEKCKLLEKSLRILAQENHDLEQQTNYENNSSMLQSTNKQRQATFQSVIENNEDDEDDDDVDDDDDDEEDFYDIDETSSIHTFQSTIQHNQTQSIKTNSCYTSATDLITKQNDDDVDKTVKQVLEYELNKKFRKSYEPLL